MSKEIIARCITCNREFTEEDIKDSMKCPYCGDIGIPCSPKNDVTIKINWHELRILTIWAEQWASRCKENSTMPVTVEAIARRLEKQYPNKTPLTLAGELSQLRKHPNFKVTDTTIDESGRKIAGEHL